MSFTFYDASIVEAKRALAALTSILKKAEADANSANFVTASIHPDMLPLSFQVHNVTDTSHKLVARLTGVEPVVYDRAELKTFADFFARIAKVEEAVNATDKDLVNKRQGELVALGVGSEEIPAVGFVTGYALPNIFFHLVTAYNILRKEGIALGKLDYISHFIGEYRK